MSAILSYMVPNAVIVLTDGAIYDASGILLDVRRKVHLGKSGKVAIATRGGMLLGDTIAEQIIGWVDEQGFDATMDSLPAILPLYAVGDQEHDQVEVLIAGVSEKAGPVHRVFNTVGGYDFQAFELHDPGRSFWGVPNDGGSYTFQDMGVRMPHAHEMPSDFFATVGPKIFEFFRRMPAKPGVWSASREYHHMIGGQLDMTVVTSGGAWTETVHRWPDRIGNKISPSTSPAAVPAGLNRKQRRALNRRAA